MAHVILWTFALLGGAAAIGGVAFVLLELWAEREQREGKNPFEQ